MRRRAPPPRPQAKSVSTQRKDNRSKLPMTRRSQKAVRRAPGHRIVRSSPPPAGSKHTEHKAAATYATTARRRFSISNSASTIQQRRFSTATIQQRLFRRQAFHTVLPYRLPFPAIPHGRPCIRSRSRRRTSRRHWNHVESRPSPGSRPSQKQTLPETDRHPEAGDTHPKTGPVSPRRSAETDRLSRPGGTQKWMYRRYADKKRGSMHSIEPLLQCGTSERIPPLPVFSGRIRNTCRADPGCRPSAG